MRLQYLYDLYVVAQLAYTHEQQATLLIDSRDSLLDPCVDNIPCLLSECQHSHTPFCGRWRDFSCNVF